MRRNRSSLRSIVLTLLFTAALLVSCTTATRSIPTPIDADQYPQETVAPAPRLGAAPATPTVAVTARAVAGIQRPLPGTLVPSSVTIVDFEFQPASVTIQRGAIVTWTNGGRTAHRVVADSGAFDKGQMAPGRSVVQTFPSAGTIAYHCAIHPSMRGSIIVQ